MSTCARRPYICVVKYDKVAVPCILYLHVIWLGVRPQRDETTWWKNIFLPGEVHHSEVCLTIKNLLFILTELILYSDQDHDIHSCDTRLCPVPCDLCKRLCIWPHLHGLSAGRNVHHLCGWAWITH